VPIAFRSRAIAAGSAGDALTERVRVVRPPAWFALALAAAGLAGLMAWTLMGRVAVTTKGSGVVTNSPGNIAVVSPAEGVIVETVQTTGTAVTTGDTLVAVETRDGQRYAVTSPVEGTVVGVGPGVGAAVARGEDLATVAPASPTQVAYVFVPSAANNGVNPGMAVLLSPASTDSTVDGLLKGVVSSVSPLPVSEARVRYIMGSPALTASALDDGPVDEVQVALTPADTPSGWEWTRSPGPAAPVVSGTPADGVVILELVRPYSAFAGTG
jgi:hypothetical protein